MEYAFYFKFFISLWIIKLIMQQNLNNHKIEMNLILKKI